MKSRARLAIALCSLAATLPAAGAQDLDDYFTAVAKFEKLASNAALNRSMPRVSTPDVAAAIRTLSDHQRFLDAPRYRVSDMGTLLKVCDKANALVMSYALFDLKSSVDVKAAPAMVSRMVVQGMERNLQIYQDELELLQPFLIRCLGKEVPLMTEFADGLKPQELTDIRRTGLKQGQDGMFRTVYGALQIASNSSFKESYRTGLLRAIADNARLFSSVLTVPVRQQVLALARSTTETAPQSLRKYLGKIADAMSEPSCVGLCKYR
jgi:hypothetical protein